MESAQLSYRQAIQDAMDVLHGRWVVAVLASLAAQPLTYLELLGDINSLSRRRLSQKVLSSTLRKMRKDGLVIRSGPKSPFQEVWYELSPLGETLLRSLRPVAKWAMDNVEAVAVARVQFDSSLDES